MKLTLLSILLLASACSSSSATGPAAAPDGGSASGASAADGSSVSSCTAAIAQTLMPIDKVSPGIVSVLASDAGATRDIFVGAYAGGPGAAATNPYVYVNLASAMRVDVTDVGARASTDWDLALKRYVIFTNGGDGGIGQGAATHVATVFDSVTAADAMGMTTESFIDPADGGCNAKTDLLGGLVTTFSDWYSYDQATNKLTPQSLTYIVRGGTGKLYKVAIHTYYGSLNGGTGPFGGDYVIRVAAL